MEKIELLYKDIISLINDKEKKELVINNPKENEDILERVHELYNYICNNNIEIEKNMMIKISSLNAIYIYFFKILKQQNVLPFDVIKDKLNKRIIDMKTIDGIDSFYPYYKDIHIASTGTKLFSIEKQYQTFPRSNSVYELNGVTVITPSQTISLFNSKESDGRYSGYHDDNFRTIFHSVYGQDFKYNYTGQDIKIRHINTSYKGIQTRGMTIEIPVPINSSQKTSLINLNNQIKSLNQLGININIEVALLKEDFYEFYNIRCKNLDNLLDNLLINDSLEYKYKEQFFIGESNIDCSYIVKKYY